MDATLRIAALNSRRTDLRQAWRMRHERKLANGKTRIDFQTDPSRYRHWKLAVDGDVATLTMDVDEKGGLYEGYELKLNSYDLGVDIELADAIERLRFEHPQVKVVLLRSAKPRVFCAGANIRMLAGATHAHKVNFCKFTNETRNGIEDASEASGLKTICVINGTAAGGGYELALAADHIILVDDGSSAVSLPELPLLAVLPGTGGLTRVTDKRKVRRDHADFFCTTEEGVKGKRAVEWRLVDEVVPGSKFDDAVKQRAQDFATKSQRGNGAKGIALKPLKRERAGDAVEYSAVSVAFERAGRLATITLRGPEARAAEDRPTRWSRWARSSGRCGSHANSTTRFSTSASTSSTSPRSCSSRPATASRCWPTTPSSKPTRATGSAREIAHYWKRVLKRVDLTSRSLVALGRAGLLLCRHAGRTRVRDRPLLHADRPARRRQQAAGDDGAVGDEFRCLSDVERDHAAGEPLPRQSGAGRGRAGRSRPHARRRDGRADGPRDLRARRHRLGGRGARVPGGARELLARRAHRAGSESAFRRTRDDGIENLRAPHRLAELDLPAPERGRRGGRAETLRHRPAAGVRHEEGLECTALSPSS